MSRLFLLSAIRRSAGRTLGSDPGCRNPALPAGATGSHEGPATVATAAGDDAAGATDAGATDAGATTAGATTADARGGLGLWVLAIDAGDDRATDGELLAANPRGAPDVDDADVDDADVDDADVPDSTPITTAAAASVVTPATMVRRRKYRSDMVAFIGRVGAVASPQRSSRARSAPRTSTVGRG